MHLAPYNLRVPGYLPTLYAKVLVDRAQLAVQENDPARAEAWLREAVTLNPADPKAHLALCHCLEKQGKNEEAQTYRKRWQRLKDQDERAGALLGQLKHFGQDADLRCQLGETLLELGSDRDALHWFENALRLDPRHERTRKVLQQY
jgi:Tfp pilus assembly protein PilF